MFEGIEVNKKLALLREEYSLEDLSVGILKNNIFGVDLNEESVEITKLSLWLKTAKKTDPLTSLDNNIRCGNSLIGDENIAGEKAFKWEVEFKEIMDNGGFDIVIGNPPYVSAESISDVEKKYFEKKYISAFGRMNLYIIFYELGLKILKKEGLLSYITPYTVLKNKYYIELRKIILNEYCLLEIVDFKNQKIFEDAVVDSIIMTIKNSKENKEINVISEITDFLKRAFKHQNIEKSLFLKNTDFSFDINNNTLLEKVNDNTVLLKEIVSFKQGIITGNNKEYLKDTDMNGFVKIIQGKDFNRYLLDFNNIYLDYTNDKLHRPRTSKIFEVPKKILLRQTGSYPIVTIDTNGYYTLDSVHNGVLINEKYNIYYIVAVLNSKLIRYIYESKINESGKVFAQVKIIYIDEIPIKEIDIELQNQLFDDKVNCMFELNKKICNLSQKFISYISDKYNLLKITAKIQEFYLYDFNFNSVSKTNKS